MPKRLVIFGCGYVGTAVGREALARGVRVTALTRNPAQAEALRATGIETCVADLAGNEWHAQITGRADYVLNCVSPGGGGLEGYRRSYVEGMMSLLAWARAAGPVGTIVHTSSTSVYPQDGGVRVAEDAKTDDASATAALLLEAEARLRAAADAGERWFVLRLAGIYGPGRHHFIEQVRIGEASGRAENHLNLAHRDDIVSAIWSCFTAPAAVRNEIFNVADEAPAKKGEIVAWVAERMGVPPPCFTGTAVAGRGRLTPDRIISNAKLKRTLGWRPYFADYRAGCEAILAAGAGG